MKIRTVSVTGDIKSWRGRAVNGSERWASENIGAGERRFSRPPPTSIAGCARHPSGRKRAFAYRVSWTPRPSQPRQMVVIAQFGLHIDFFKALGRMPILRVVKHTVHLVVALMVMRLGWDCLVFNQVLEDSAWILMTSLKLKTLISSHLFLTIYT